MFEEVAAGIIGQGVLYTLLVVVGLILLDTALGVLKAVKGGSFDTRLLADYLKTGVLPYVGGLVILGVGALYVQPEIMGAIFAVSAITAITKYATDIYDKARILFGVKLETECSICGEPMPYSLESFEGEPVCDRCFAGGVAEEEAEEGDPGE